LVALKPVTYYGGITNPLASPRLILLFQALLAMAKALSIMRALRAKESTLLFGFASCFR